MEICSSVSRGRPFSVSYIVQFISQAVHGFGDGRPSKGVKGTPRIHPSQQRLCHSPSVRRLRLPPAARLALSQDRKHAADAQPTELHSMRIEFQSKQNGLRCIPRKTEYVLPLSLKELSIFGTRKSQGPLCFKGLI